MNIKTSQPKITPNTPGKTAERSFWRGLASPGSRPWVAAFAAGVAITLYAFLVEPGIVAYPAGSHSAIFVLLFACLTLISCLLPVTGPRLAQRVPLTALVAAVATIVLPPAMAVVPIAFAALPALLMLDDRMTRQQTLGRFLLLALVQLTTGMIMLRFGILPIPRGMPFDAEAARCGMVLVAFGILYLSGLGLMRHAPRRPGPPEAGHISEEIWSLIWFNESAVFIAGGVPAAMIAALMLRGGGWLGAAVSIPVASVLALVGGMFVERKLLVRQVRAMQALTETAALAAAPKVGRLLDEFLKHSRSLILYDRATIWLYNEADTILVEARQRPPLQPSATSERQVRRIGEELVGLVAERRKPMLVADIRRDARHSAHRLVDAKKASMGPVSQLLLPMVAGGELIGVAEFERQAWSAFRAADRERLQSLTTLAAMGAANIRRHQDMVQQAVTDGLTGLHNKRHVTQLLADEMRRAQRYGHTMSVLMMDIDGFKSYNDTYGHPQGDILLRQMAQIIQQSVRTSDHVGRYGGEEFIVVMPETPAEGALQIAERIRRAIEVTPFPGKTALPPSLPDESLADVYPDTDESWVHKTISIGAATFPRDAADVTMLVAIADNALYDAKHSGRNQVVSAGDHSRQVAA